MRPSALTLITFIHAAFRLYILIDTDIANDRMAIVAGWDWILSLKTVPSQVGFEILYRS